MNLRWIHVLLVGLALVVGCNKSAPETPRVKTDPTLRVPPANPPIDFKDNKG